MMQKSWKLGAAINRKETHVKMHGLIEWDGLDHKKHYDEYYCDYRFLKMKLDLIEMSFYRDISSLNHR